VGLQISIRQCGDVSILDLLGRSTIEGESQLLSRYLRELTATGKSKLLLNLMNLSQIDSSGVSIIVEMYVSLKRTGGELKLLSPRGRVLDVLTVFRLLDVIPSFEDDQCSRKLPAANLLRDALITGAARNRGIKKDLLSRVLS
jgi:anti-anti-sigma factor